VPAFTLNGMEKSGSGIYTKSGWEWI
jgi:hypothetical protein